MRFDEIASSPLLTPPSAEPAPVEGASRAAAPRDDAPPQPLAAVRRDDGHRRQPRRRSGLVRRDRLVRVVADTADMPLVTLVAPAGYGKTTLLTQWADADPRPFAWLTLDELHDDPARLLAAISRRLRELEPTDAAARERRAAVLVLDDVHVLRSLASLAALWSVASRMSPGCTLALASRAELPLPLGRLRADGDVIELRTRDLATTPREGELLLRRAGVPVTAAQAAALVRRTEGWPAALHLAARSLLEQRDGGGVMASRAAGFARGAASGDLGNGALGFAGDDRLVADYVRDELLARLTPAEASFLLRASPLRELSGPLCDAALELEGSGALLRSLARSTLLLIPLDRAEERFRCHALVGEMLRAELRRVEPGSAARTHLRASAWCERQGDVAGAIDHAIAADDPARAGELLWSVALAYAADGRLTTLTDWLDRFEDVRLCSHPALALAAAVARLIAGRRDDADRFAAAANRALDAAPRDALVTGAAIVRAAVGSDGRLGSIRDECARAQAIDGDWAWRSFACLLDGVALHLGDDEDAGCERLEEGARRAANAVPVVAALCRAQLALAAIDRDEWERAGTLAERARDDLARAGDSPLSALVLAVCARVHAHRGSVRAARADAAAARRLLAEPEDVAPWYAAETRIVLARTELRLSDSGEARLLLTEASRALRRVPDAIVLRRWLDETWARADTYAIDAVRGDAKLTIAELRVLRLLPSHFCFREIAARLHVSINTVKSQAQAVYRKLDVSSRSEAVARARAAGLVDG